MKKFMAVLAVLALSSGAAAKDEGPGLFYDGGRWYGTRSSLPQQTPPTETTIEEVLRGDMVDAYNLDAKDMNLPIVTPEMVGKHPGAVAWMILKCANQIATSPEKAKVLKAATPAKVLKPAKVIKPDTRQMVTVMRGLSQSGVEFGSPAIIQPAVIQPAQAAVIQPSREGDPNDYRHLNAQTFVLNPADTQVARADYADLQSGPESYKPGVKVAVVK